YNAEAVKILIFAAEGLTKRSAVGFLLRSLIMFQTFISRHNSNFFSDKLVLTSVTPASSAPVLQTPKATSSTLYFDSLTVNAGNGGFLHCIQMDTSVNAANQVVSVGADIAFDADPKFFACLVRFESSSVPTTLPTAYDVYPLDRKSGSAGMPRPISYAVFCLKKKNSQRSPLSAFSTFSSLFPVSHFSFFSLSSSRHLLHLHSFPTRRSSDLSTPLIRLFLLVLILLLMPTLNFLPVWFALSLLRFRLPSRLPMMFILWMVAMMVVIIPSRTV